MALMSFLWFDRPAVRWTEALPLGNGRLGAMVFGGVEEEVFCLNDDTLYSGGPDTRSFTPDVTVRFDEVRALLRAGRYAEAEKIVSSDWLGVTHTSYQPLGDLRLRFSPGGTAEAYRRELHLDEGRAVISFRLGEVEFRREIFISHPDDVLVCRLTASRPRALNFSISLTSVHLGSRFRVEPDGLGLLTGRAPTLAMKRTLEQIRALGDAPKYPELFDENGQPRPGASQVSYDDRGMGFAALVKATTEDGDVVFDSGEWRVQGATCATLVLSSGTGFVDFRSVPTGDPEARPRQALRDAPKDYEILRRRHVEDFGALYRRMDIQLGETSRPLPTDRRREEMAAGRDVALAALNVQFSRYLLISASRAGTEPMNLQGLWNTEVVPPWNCGYTLNINTEMNYWLAEIANLSECHEPMLRLVREAAENGKRLAQEMFGRSGWVCFHNLSIWRDVQPSDGQVCWAFWPMAQAWLVRHYWEHFAYSGDLTGLREAYPIIRGAAEFLLDWLVEDEDGFLITPAGTSPENSFVYEADGVRTTASLSPGPTTDVALARECLTVCLEAAVRLETDEAFREQLEKVVPRLRPYGIGPEGQLREWHRDFEDAELSHRHVSHLFGVFPSAQITEEKHPELAAAARRTLDRRGDESTGWSTAWKACLWARLGDGDRAWNLLRSLWGPEHSYPNLFSVHPPFQIDGNFGGPAALLEMLLQSHAGFVEILPALPRALADGSVRGLRARGGFELSFSWKEHLLAHVEILSTGGGECRLRYGEEEARFETIAGGRYCLGRDFTWRDRSARSPTGEQGSTNSSPDREHWPAGGEVRRAR
jgi:alpha-L-fucosidase 2